MTEAERTELMARWHALALAQIDIANAAEDMVKQRNAVEMAGIATTKALALSGDLVRNPDPVEGAIPW